MLFCLCRGFLLRCRHQLFAAGAKGHVIGFQVHRQQADTASQGAVVALLSLEFKTKHRDFIIGAHFFAFNSAACRVVSARRKLRSREFKDAMRQRIRDIAASRDLSDEEIKPVLKLKHEEVARCTEKHGVNLGWLLEGEGRIFKKDQQEFAAVVATMPEADQQAIRTMVREIVQERDQ